MEFKSKFFKFRMIGGFSLGFVAALSSGIGAGLFSKVMEMENRANVQQSIGDTSLILTNHFRNEFKNLIDHLIELAKVPSKTSVDTFVENSDLIAYSVWRREQSFTFDHKQFPFQRMFLALNSKNPPLFSLGLSEIQNAFEKDNFLIQIGFNGHTMIALSPGFGLKNVAIIVLPMNQSLQSEVIVAYFQLSRLQKVFNRESMVFAALVDDFGNVLAKPNAQAFFKGKTVNRNPLFQSMRSSGLTSGQLNFKDEHGESYYGGYSLLGIGQLALLASVSQSEVFASVQVFKKQSRLFFICCFLFFFCAGYLLTIRLESKFVKLDDKFSQKNGTAEESNLLQHLLNPEIRNLTVIFGSLRYFPQILIQENPQSATSSINEYFTITASTIKAYGGNFEIIGKSFIGVWGVFESDGSDIWRALRCTLDIRQNFFKLNEARRVDGQKELFYSLGVHAGKGLAARLGEMKDLKIRVVGEVVSHAQALQQLSQNLEQDILVSQSVWQLSDAKFTGDLLGEAKLASDSGLISYYNLTGYRNEEGEAISVDYVMNSTQLPYQKESENLQNSIIIKENHHLRWLVNNGSQIIGPLAPEEIASRLFAQELDFDCECWAEGLGNSAQIKNAEIFSGSQDKSASLWVYDGKLVHGPVSSGFIKTAIGHGAISQSGYICEGTTVSGWKPLSDWDFNYIPKAELNDKQNESQLHLVSSVEKEDSQSSSSTSEGNLSLKKAV